MKRAPSLRAEDLAVAADEAVLGVAVLAVVAGAAEIAVAAVAAAVTRSYRDSESFRK